MTPTFAFVTHVEQVAGATEGTLETMKLSCALGRIRLLYLPLYTWGIAEMPNLCISAKLPGAAAKSPLTQAPRAPQEGKRLNSESSGFHSLFELAAPGLSLYPDE